MLHCLGMTHRLWDCLGGIADRHTLISYDLPGHGETALPASPYGIEELSAQLAAVLRREGIARAPTLVVCGSEESDAFKDAARWLGEHIAGARVEFVERAAHASMLERQW
jgi:pimeloyl-ACP methyl ester carboxylesterase